MPGYLPEDKTDAGERQKQSSRCKTRVLKNAVGTPATSSGWNTGNAKRSEHRQRQADKRNEADGGNVKRVAKNA